jgi:hypothetical protein
VFHLNASGTYIYHCAVMGYTPRRDTEEVRLGYHFRLVFLLGFSWLLSVPLGKCRNITLDEKHVQARGRDDEGWRGKARKDWVLSVCAIAWLSPPSDLDTTFIFVTVNKVQGYFAVPRIRPQPLPSRSRNSSVGIPTGYGLDGRVRFFCTPQHSDRLWGPRSLLTTEYRRPFPGGKAAGT